MMLLSQLYFQYKQKLQNVQTLNDGRALFPPRETASTKLVAARVIHHADSSTTSRLVFEYGFALAAQPTSGSSVLIPVDWLLAEVVVQTARSKQTVERITLCTRSLATTESDGKLGNQGGTLENLPRTKVEQPMKKAVAAVVLMLGFMVGCSSYSPDAGHEVVLVEKPYIFGHGGVDSDPVKTGRTFHGDFNRRS
jgi:hypothetical protein